MQPLIGISCCYDNVSGRFNLGEDYVLAVRAAGGVPVILPHAGDADMPEILRAVDGVLLSGGSDLDPDYFGEEPLPENGYIDPLRDQFEIQLARMTLAAEIPLLGICRGMQVMNVATGGKVHQDIGLALDKYLQHMQQAPRWYPTHGINIAKYSILYNILKSDKLRVNSFHHQIISSIGENFTISATARDGVIEAIESVNSKNFALGVQFHPENMYKKKPIFLQIFAAFVRAAARYLSSKKGRLTQEKC